MFNKITKAKIITYRAPFLIFFRSYLLLQRTCIEYKNETRITLPSQLNLLFIYSRVYTFDANAFFGH